MSTSMGWKPLRRPGRPHLGTTPFARLALAHVLSTSGDTLLTMALADSVFFSISPDAARDRVALYLALTMAPFAVVAPILGPMLDKHRGGRRWMMVAAAGARAVVCLFMATHLDGLLLFPLAFTVLVCSKAHMVTKSALVPATVENEGELVEANSRLAVLSVLGGVAVAIPGLAILKIPFLGAPWLMRVAAVVLGAAVIAGFRLMRPTEPKASVPIAAQKAELHAATIRLSVTAMAILRGCVGFLVFLAAFSLRGDDSSPIWYGAILAASMAGSFAGAAVAPRLRRAVAEEKILSASLGLVLCAGLIAAWIGGRPALALLAGALGVAAGTGKLAFDSIVQRDAPDAVWGRTFARYETRFQLVWVLAAAVPVVVPIPTVIGILVIAFGCGVALVMYVGGLGAAHKAHTAGDGSVR
ncbi:MAG TPA: MFS transporter [Acidimicrobiales bacterium]|nr:MFS transporter [Acidimicrobiales bacterium]